MIDSLGVIGKLLESVGRIGGRAFHVVDCAADVSPPLPAGLSAYELRQVEQETSRADGAASICTADGNWICGISVPSEESTRRVIFTDPIKGKDPRTQRDMLDLLGHVKHLMAERRGSVHESTRLAEELGQTYEDLYLFSRIATQVRSLHFSKEMVQGLLSEVRDAMRVDLAAAEFSENPEDNVYVTSPESGTPVPDAAGFLTRLCAQMQNSATVLDGNCLIVNTTADCPELRSMHAAVFRALAVRVSNGDRHYGWLLLVSFNMDEIFRRGELRLLETMAQQVALVLANSELYRDLELSVIGLVKSLVLAIEAKDQYTRGHTERVSEHCMRMADELGLDARQRQNLQWASVLHDLGKIGTPESILNKPSRLSKAEFECVQEHPAKGAEILASISQLADALPAIRHHHEHYDGRGYPDGLQGEQIPLLARVIAVADTYDAITSARAYREARSDAEAMHIITTCSGTQLDPKLTDAFRRTLSHPAHAAGAPPPRVAQEARMEHAAQRGPQP